MKRSEYVGDNMDNAQYILSTDDFLITRCQYLEKHINKYALGGKPYPKDQLKSAFRDCGEALIKLNAVFDATTSAIAKLRNKVPDNNINDYYDRLDNRMCEHMYEIGTNIINIKRCYKKLGVNPDCKHDENHDVTSVDTGEYKERIKQRDELTKDNIKLERKARREISKECPF